MRKLYFLFFIFSSIFSFSQYFEIKDKPYRERYMILDSLLEQSKKIPNREIAEKKSEEIIALAKKYNNKELELEGQYFLAFYTLAAEKYDEEKAVEEIEKICNFAAKENVLHIQIRGNYILGYYFWYVKRNYERGFRYFLKTTQLLKKTNPKDFPNWASYQRSIANAYYVFRDYKTAINLLRKTDIKYTSIYNWKDVWGSFNNLGVFYHKINKLDSSQYFYEKALQTPYMPKNGNQITITKGNIGNILYKKGNFEKAIPLIIADYDNGVKEQEYGLAASAAISLADIYSKKKDFSKAENYLKITRPLIKKSGQNFRLEEYYKVYSSYYLLQNNLNKANIYQDSLIFVIKENQKEFDPIMLLRAQQKESLANLEDQKQKHELSEKINRATMILIICVSLLILSGILVFYNFKRKKFKLEQKNKELEINAAQQKLKSAEEELNSFRKRIENIQKVSNSITQLEIQGIDSESLEELRQSTILTEESWRKFSQHFDTIYPGYTYRLKEKIPSITPAELRLVLLAKLKLDSKEISSALGISGAGVRTTWYRLRKKIDAEEDYTLSQLAENI